MPSRREFMGVLGATLGVLAGRTTAHAQGRRPRRQSAILNVSTGL